MDGGLQCQPDTTAITAGPMIDGGREGGDGEKEIEREASITPLNLSLRGKRVKERNKEERFWSGLSC